jgi:protein TonB
MVDKTPQVLKRGPVPYPESARRNRLSGDVLIRFLLNEKGEISHIQVIHADPPEVFNNSALMAIQKWKFSPAVKDGKPVPVWVELPMHFSLR